LFNIGIKYIFHYLCNLAVKVVCLIWMIVTIVQTKIYIHVTCQLCRIEIKDNLQLAKWKLLYSDSFVALYTNKVFCKLLTELRMGYCPILLTCYLP